MVVQSGAHAFYVIDCSDLIIPMNQTDHEGIIAQCGKYLLSTHPALSVRSKGSNLDSVVSYHVLQRVDKCFMLNSGSNDVSTLPRTSSSYTAKSNIDGFRCA